MMDWLPFACFGVAAVVSAGLMPLLIGLAGRLGLEDVPDARKVHEKPIPRIGGIGIWVGLMTGVTVTFFAGRALGYEFSFQLSKSILAIVAAATFVAIVGFVDDIRSISSRFKMVALILAAVVLCGSGATLGGLSLGGREYLQFIWLDWMITVLWISGIAVAVNFIDGLDGLAGGLVGLSALVLAGFLLAGASAIHAALVLSLLGAIVGFLVFNWHPAKIFMGDSGAMLIGVAMASFMLVSNSDIGTMRAIVLPSLALSIPIADCTFTFFRRHYLQRRSVFSAERGHIHHRLLDRGLRHPHAVWVLYSVSVLAVGIGLVALAFEGLGTFAGLSLMLPLLWGTFRLAGSVRTSEMVHALRAKRNVDRETKRHRGTFESMQLKFACYESVSEWWRGVSEAAEELEFCRVVVVIDPQGSGKQLRWDAPDESLFSLQTLSASIPVADAAEFGDEARVEVDIAITQCMETASSRLALFSRLVTECSLKTVRRRERAKLAKSSPKVVRRGASPAKPSGNPLPVEGNQFGHLNVALVHDFFYTYCGAERVVEQIINVFPHCDVFALFDFLPEEERGFLRGKHVHTSMVHRLPFARSKHRSYLPIMPFAIEQLDVSNYDLVISSSYLAAKGVITGPDQLHVCYCHSPVRYAWDLQHQYLNQANLGYSPKGLFARWILHYLRSWDVRSSMGVDHFIANSNFVSRRIMKLYRRQSRIINPPVDTDQFELNEKPREEFYLLASRMVPYKRMDLIVSAFQRMPTKQLVVIGDGPEMERIRGLAGENVTILGFQSNEVLTDYMRRAKALLFAAEEDFGIVPVEALACGTPVIAYGKGGVTESVVEGEHGVFFYEQTEESVCAAVESFEARASFDCFDSGELRAQSMKFSNQSFREKLSRQVLRWTEERWSASPTRSDSLTRLDSPGSDGVSVSDSDIGHSETESHKADSFRDTDTVNEGLPAEAAPEKRPSTSR
ncbi:MAG: glycosyltransferase [Aureliella sp.]